MDPFIDQLRALCAAHPTRAKWVFVPTHGIGRTIGDRLAREGTDWANLRFVTPLDIALRMGAPFLVERGIDPSEEGLGPALVMRLLLALPEEGGHFRPLASQPQLALAIWSTLRELRMAGLRAADLPASAFANEHKHRELVAFLISYEKFLADHRRGDFATVFEEALQHPDWCPIQPKDCWIDLPDVRWQPLERRLIAAMPGERLLAPDARLPAPDFRRPASSSDIPAEFFHAGSPEAEIEETFRRILASACALDSVEIVCANPLYSSLIWEKAIRYGWPVTVERGLPVSLTRPGRALVAFTEWIEDDFAAGRLRRMLQSGDLRLERELTMSPARAARLLVTAQAAWGRHTFRLSFRRLATSSRRRADRDDLPADQREGLKARADQCDALGAWIDTLIASVPEPDAARTVSLRDVADCARSFVDRATARTSALDRLAAVALVDAIADLRALDDFRCSLDRALHFLRERVDSLVVGADRPRPGQLHVSALSTAGFAGRSSIFVVGLEEGRVFPAPFEDPILLDAERRAISADLMRSTDRTDEAVATGLGRLATMSAQPGATITFSYSCRDLREYRQTYASWLMLHAWREATGHLAATYQELHKALGTPRSCVPDRPALALDASRWWLHGAMRSGETARQDVLARYPALAAGQAAAAARDSSLFTPYDGYVPVAGPVLDPCAAHRVVSPTQLEDAASCPFRYFLRRGLGVEAIESGDRDRDVWLDPLLRGSLLHDLYAELLKRCRSAKRRVALPEDAAWLEARGRTALDDLAVEMPPPSGEIADRESRLLLEDLRLFVEAEASLDQSRTPLGFEVGFGRGGPDADEGNEVEPLAQSDPVLIDLGGGLTLRIAGRIDRIDEVGSASFEIIDYKTGGYWADSWMGTFAGGTRLQHALYGLAAVELLRRSHKKATVAGAEYYFSSAKGQQERKRIPTQSLARVSEVLADLRQVIASGVFIHAADDEACKWCDYGHACGGGAAARAAAKQGDPRVAPFIKLASHE